MNSAARDLDHEREALQSTLAEVGPDAPTTCGTWTTTDLAVHVVTGELVWAVPNAPFRVLVGKGVRLDRMAGANERALRRYRRRHGFDWALARLGRPAPRLHRAGVVAAVSLLEMWSHHEDVLAANDVGACRSGVDLAPVVRVLVRYQGRFLAEHGVVVASVEEEWYRPPGEARVEMRGSKADLTRWLAGRTGVDGLTVSGHPDAIASARELKLRL